MRRFLPWLFAGLVIAFLLKRIPPAEIAFAFGAADIPLLVCISAVGACIWFWMQSATYAYLFSQLGTPLSWKDARSIRGVTYLLAPIHWNVGKAAVVFQLHRLRRVPILEGTSALLLYQIVSLIALLLLASAGLAYLSLSPYLSLSRSSPDTALVIPAISPALPIAAAIGIAATCLALRANRPNIEPLRRLRALRLIQAFRNTRPVDLAVLVGVKSIYHLVFAGVFFVGLRAFGVELPFLLVFIATPLIQIAGGLPITPAGLGTQQAAMLYFFAGRSGEPECEAAVAAFSFSFPLILLLIRAAIGLFYLALPAPKANHDAIS